MSSSGPLPVPTDGLEADVRAVLGAGSRLTSLPGFEVRPEQISLAARIARSLTERTALIAESATGTGKTFAYLVPALLHPGRTVLSTGNKELQEQLLRKDLPLAQRALGTERRVALLKGRSNYLCRVRAEAVSGPMQESFERVRAWAESSADGDLAQAPDLVEGDPLWAALTAEADQCLGGACRAFDRCFVQQARRQAAEADVVVVNHHLFLADRRLGDEGFTRLLPAVDHVIFDEAHQLPAIAGGCFGVNVHSGALRRWCEAFRKADQEESLAIAGLEDGLAQIAHLTQDVRRVAGDTEQRYDLADAPDALLHILNALAGALSAVLSPLVDSGVRGEWSAQVVRTGQRLSQEMEQVLAGASTKVAWLQVTRAGFSVHLTPASSGPEFRRALGLDGPCPTYVFLSATLSVGGDFSFFQRMLDLGDVATGQWQGAFDYAHQTILYLPPGLPDPGTDAFLDVLIERILPVLHASEGRAFVLFTTRKALQYVRRRWAGGIGFPLFVQGEMPQALLLEGFRASGNGVLLGLASFWEGVDVAGAALSCVIIDKLPFAPPSDPVERARVQMVETEGGDGFRDYQLPKAVLALKQGVGRLIRTGADRGAIVLCDPRLRTRSYGRIFLKSLPDMPVTDELGAVQEFFSRTRA